MCYNRPVKKTDSIAILGYGVEGRAICEYLLRHGYRDVTVCDQNEVIEGLVDGVKFRGGSDYLNALDRFDVVFRSPGISFFKREIQELLGSRTGVSSMTKYFFEHCRVPVVGVTGTKGKGTTASLITDILRRGGKKVFLGGNIGVPAVNFLDELREECMVVLELSSFQLVDLEMSPHIAVVLNVTSDHMDYHASVEEYHESKYPIVAFQGESDFALLNADYPYSVEFGKLGLGEKIFFSVKKDGAGGVVNERDIALLGRHNWENILPAIAVARLYDIGDDVIGESLRTFRGLEHRLEKVENAVSEREDALSHCGVTRNTVDRGSARVEFYNDSFSTTPEACIAACSAFNDLERPFFLIAGGSEKGSDFGELGLKLSRMKFLQKVFLMGPSGVRIGEALAAGHAELPVACEVVSSLREAVTKAYEEAMALPCDARAVILMSPAAASFNEFTNYKERGKKFKELARGLMRKF